MNNNLKILVIDDDVIHREGCRDTLVRSGHDVDLAENGARGLALMDRWAYDVVLLDLRMPGVDGMEALARIRQQDPDALIIVISGYGSVANAVQAMKAGAFDFLPKPFTPAELRRAVERAAEKRQLMQENAFLREELRRRRGSRQVVAASPAMRQVLQLLERAAVTDATVLITGESGTGKGHLARRLHELSPRRDHPFVAVDCSTLVPTLFESELFGHVKGAFTGAESSKVGKFEHSSGGTLFLDEVSNISPEIQAKLLKAVEERAIMKVGSNRVIRVDTRLVAASNRDLDQLVGRGEFRQDLFYRLNVVALHLPPLRQRPEDIPPLVELSLEAFRGLSPVRVRELSPGAMELMAAYPWPGNVRELMNTMQRILVLASGPRVRAEQVRAALPSTGPAPQPVGGPVEEPTLLTEVERLHIQKVLESQGGHISRTADALGINRKTLRLKMRRYNLAT